MKALIIGRGQVGITLSKLLTSKGWEPTFFNSRNLEQLESAVTEFSIVFLTISTKDKGAAAFEYIQCICKHQIPIVTCEKAALAYYFKELHPYLHLLGCNASVGGACGFPSIISAHKNDILGLRAIVNSTINFILWARQSGMSTEGALYEAQKKGLCESNSLENPEEVFALEIQDALMKACIMFNFSGVGEYILPIHFGVQEYSQIQIQTLLNNREKTRFVVEIVYYPGTEHFPLHNSVFYYYQQPWLIKGSFMPQAKELFPEINIDQENNALIIERTDRARVYLCGPGAGPEHIAERMWLDALELLQIDA